MCSLQGLQLADIFAGHIYDLLTCQGKYLSFCLLELVLGFNDETDDNQLGDKCLLLLGACLSSFLIVSLDDQGHYLKQLNLFLLFAKM